MSGEERRTKIIERIEAADKPISATALAKEFGVSRQIIVGDIALIRANATDIIATNKGYIMAKQPESSSVTAVIKVKHKPEDMYDELCSIVDMGGRIKDEAIKSDLYGTVSIEININNRADAKAFTERFIESGATPLSELTKGIHYHTIEADNQLVLIRVQKALNEKGYLTK